MASSKRLICLMQMVVSWPEHGELRPFRPKTETTARIFDMRRYTKNLGALKGSSRQNDLSRGAVHGFPGLSYVDAPRELVEEIVLGTHADTIESSANGIPVTSSRSLGYSTCET